MNPEEFMRWDALVASDYQRGDMAHPVRGTDWRAAFTDPDNWAVGLLLGLMIVVVLIWTARPPA